MPILLLWGYEDRRIPWAWGTFTLAEVVKSGFSVVLKNKVEKQ